MVKIATYNYNSEIDGESPEKSKKINIKMCKTKEFSNGNFWK